MIFQPSPTPNHPPPCCRKRSKLAHATCCSCSSRYWPRWPRALFAARAACASACCAHKPRFPRALAAACCCACSARLLAACAAGRALLAAGCHCQNFRPPSLRSWKSEINLQISLANFGLQKFYNSKINQEGNMVIKKPPLLLQIQRKNTTENLTMN